MRAVLALGTRSDGFTDVELTAFLEMRRSAIDRNTKDFLYHLAYCHRLYTPRSACPPNATLHLPPEAGAT